MLTHGCLGALIQHTPAWLAPVCENAFLRYLAVLLKFIAYIAVVSTLTVVGTGVPTAWSQSDPALASDFCASPQFQSTQAPLSQHFSAQKALNWVAVETEKTPTSDRIFLPPGISDKELALCGGYYAAPTLEPIPTQSEQTPNRIHGWAQYYQYDNQGLATLCGDVLLRKADFQVRSDAVNIHQEDQTAELIGNVTLTTEDTVLRGNRAFLQLEENNTILQNADFLLYQQGARGSAETITTRGSKQTRIHHGYYTTCPPNNNDWSLTGSEILLDHERGWGKLHHMRLKLGKVPIFYAPYFTFPLDERRHTGFLYPEFNSLSEPDLALPFYWNLAPNYDWVIKPRKIGGRGTMIESEFRYLHRPGSGSISLGYLPKDRRFDQLDRKSAHWEHSGIWGNTWRWHSNVGYLSDNDYINDLGANLSAIGESYLPREWVAERSNGPWQTQLMLQSYQTIDAAITANSQPYRKLPEATVTYSTNLASSQLEWTNSATYTYLAQPEAILTPFAHRAHWRSEFSLPMSNSWYFLTPQTTLQSTYYNLLGTSTDSSISRVAPTFSIDSGLFFDRPLDWRDHTWIQSLEPRVFYTYTPYRDQQDIPAFDTTALTFGFDQLFRSNRFSGIDRIGDSHRTTLAATSRLTDAQGHELAQVTLGQILYHKDRRVTLPNESSLTNTQSSMVLRGQSTLLSQISLTGGLTWDSKHNIIEDGNVTLSSTAYIDSAWQASYRYRKAVPNDDRIDQVNFGLRQHISGFWHFVGSLHYDLEENRTLEQLSGFQYEDCCWRTDIVYHRRIRSSTDNLIDAENEYSVLLQFEFKGLGSIGSRLDALLTENIPGYISRDH